MAKKTSRLVRLVSFEDLILTILLSWLGKKALDYFWEQAKARVRLEGETHLAYYFYSFVGGAYIDMAFSTLQGIKDDGVVRKHYQEPIRMILRVHKSYHEVLEIEKCSACQTLDLIKYKLKLYVPDLELYPPF